MTEPMDMTAWTGLMLGLYTLMAGIGALRRPGVWRQVIEETNQSPALQQTAAIVEMLAGVAIYLANAWIPTDVLSCILKTIGGLMIFEALMLAGFNDIYSNFFMRNLNFMHRGWSMFAIAQGLALTVATMLRFS